VESACLDFWIQSLRNVGIPFVKTVFDETLINFLHVLFAERQWNGPSK